MRLTRLVALLLAVLAAGSARAADLEVHFIDVGQGDALLVKSPGGKAILIDAGNIDAGPFVDAYVTKQGVAALDLVIVSHPHLDHMGGMLEVLRHHRPRAYLDPGYAHPLENYDELLDWLETESVPVKTGRGGRMIEVEPGLTLELLAPDEPLLKGTRSDANSNSVVARLVYGEVSFLFTGDSEDETENRVVQSGRPLKSTVLKVAHHGGRYSTSDGFLANVEPKYAVVSCGKINGYGHPTADTLGRLSARGVQVRRTDLDGDVIARTDGRTLRWETTGEASAKLDEPGGKRSLARGSGRDSSAHRESVRDAAPAPVVEGQLLDLNVATAEELERLPGIGDALARMIVVDRQKNGPYADVDALLRVRGIGRPIVERIRPFARAERVARPDAVVARADPPPDPVKPTSTEGPAPRPVAKPALPYRQTSKVPVPRSDEPTARIAGRLLSAPRRSRVNLNLVGAEALARAADVSLDEARRVVDWRTAHGALHSIAEVASIEGLDARARGAIMATCSVRIELNRASEADLVAIGADATAARAIVDARQALGRFATPDDLEEIEGLTPAIREKILPLVTVDDRRAWNDR